MRPFYLFYKISFKLWRGWGGEQWGYFPHFEGTLRAGRGLKPSPLRKSPEPKSFSPPRRSPEPERWARRGEAPSPSVSLPRRCHEPERFFAEGEPRAQALEPKGKNPLNAEGSSGAKPHLKRPELKARGKSSRSDLFSDPEALKESQSKLAERPSSEASVRSLRSNLRTPSEARGEARARNEGAEPFCEACFFFSGNRTLGEGPPEANFSRSARGSPRRALLARGFSWGI